MAKNPKKRDCPALGKIITRKDCGENRISRYDCPADCEFNPFAPENYSDLLELEAQLEDHLVGRLRREPKLSAEIDRLMVVAEKHPQADFLLHDAFTRNIYFAKGEDGRTVAQAYLEDEAGKLKNDMRILLRARQTARVALLEVRGVLDEQRLLAVDLLQPEAGTLTICDRSWAKRAVRYDLAFTWRYSLPHFERVTGLVGEWMGFGADPLEVLLKIAAHHGGPSQPGQALDEWLKQHMEPLYSAMHDAAYQRQRLAYERMDAMLCRASYESKGDTNELIGRLVMQPDVDDGDLDEAEESQGFRRCWDWFEPEGEAHSMFGADARVLMGRVLLGNEGNWRLQTFGEAKYNSLKALFEKCMDGKVSFKTERKDNIAAKTLGDHSPLSEEKLKRIPPELLEEVPDFDMSQARIPADRGDEEPLPLVQMRERQLKSWIDEPLPKLDGATPREASCDPGKRAELIRLVKPMIRSLDQDALKSGEVADVDWIYDELDLDEIRAAAPPLRERQDKQAFDGPSLNKPVLPPIPAREITDIDEIYNLEDRVFELLESKGSKEIGSIMTENCFTVMEALRDLVAGDDEEAIEDTMDLAQLMTPLVIMLLGTSELFEIDLDPRELEAEFDSQIQSMLAAVAIETPEGADNPLDEWFAACRQPMLLRLILMRAHGFQETTPDSFSEDSFVPMEVALCYAAALINLLSAKLDRVPR